MDEGPRYMQCGTYNRKARDRYFWYSVTSNWDYHNRRTGKNETGTLHLHGQANCARWSHWTRAASTRSKVSKCWETRERRSEGNQYTPGLYCESGKKKRDGKIDLSRERAKRERGGGTRRGVKERGRKRRAGCRSPLTHRFVFLSACTRSLLW